MPNKNLLIFNLKTDADDAVLGFTTVWINALAKRFNRVFVLTMEAGRIDVDKNVTVLSVGKEKGHSELKRAGAFYALLRRLLKREKIDACFAHMMPLFAAMGGPLLRLKKIPVVLWYTHKSTSLTLRAAAFFSKSIVTASETSCRLKSKKVIVLGHGIDTEAFAPAPAEPEKRPFTILTVGRLAEVKHLEILLDAAALIEKTKPGFPFRILIVGGPLTQRDLATEAKLKRQMAECGLTNVVDFLGAVPFAAIGDYYRRADCFVSLSDTGGLDKAVLEAMSFSLPVILSRDYESLFDEAERSEWIIDRDASQLSDHLSRMSALSEDKRRAMGSRLRQIVVERHDLTRLMNRLADLLGAD